MDLIRKFETIKMPAVFAQNGGHKRMEGAACCEDFRFPLLHSGLVIRAAHRPRVFCILQGFPHQSGYRFLPDRYS